MLTAVALTALAPASAAALPSAPTSTIQVDDSSSDAPLSSEGATNKVCESTDATHGCTLRAAVDLANALVGTAVTIEAPAGTYTNTVANGGSLEIAAGANVTIAGAGADETIIDGGGVASVLKVPHGNLSALTIKDVTIRDGSGENGGAISIATEHISADATREDDTAGPDAIGVAQPGVTVEQSQLIDNKASGNGGAIGFEDTVTSAVVKQSSLVEPATALAEMSLIVEQTTIAHDTASHYGGGLYLYESGGNEVPIASRLVNTTITDDQAGEYGGGIYVETASANLVDDTLADNTAAIGTGGNLDTADDSVVALHATLIAEPSNSPGPGCASDEVNGADARVESADAVTMTTGYNLDYPSSLSEPSAFDTCGLTDEAHEAVGRDFVGEDPRLAAGLADNGGPTETIALLGPASGQQSAAIDKVPAQECGLPTFEGGEIGDATRVAFEAIAVDQRGAKRPDPSKNGTSCDIGAYEFSPTEVVPTCTTPPTVTPGQAVTVTCTLEKREGEFATGTTATFTLPSGATSDSISSSQGTCSGTTCNLGTIDPATVTITLSPSASGELSLTASDTETGSKSTSVGVTVATPSPTIVIKSVPQCASLRHFKIHIQNVKALKVVSAVVYVDNQPKQKLEGKALTAVVNLRGLPKGTFRVKIVARTRDGKTLKGERTYHTCVPKLPGHKRLFL